MIPSTVSNCSLCSTDKNVCITHNTIKTIASELKSAASIEGIRSATGCADDTCVIKTAATRGIITKNTAAREMANLKISGPTDAGLLSNVNIDTILQQWMILFEGQFFAYNFNMLNYMDYSFKNGMTYDTPDTLATILWDDLYDKGYKCCACVINTDVYQGGGKHWMALFADWRTPTWSVEFFNSSGNAPAPEWIAWMEKTKAQMNIRMKGAANVVTVRASSMKHQKSKSECGLYSLFYIWARLNGVSYEYFKTTLVSDELMFEFRQHLFKNPKGVDETGKFNWTKYKSLVNIRWE